MNVTRDNMEPDESPGIVADATAKQESLTIGHPIDHDDGEDGGERGVLAKSLVSTMYPDV
jgi:hypothetical protein